MSIEQFEPIVEGILSSGTLLPVASSGGEAQSVLANGFNEFLFQPDADVAAALTAVCGQLQPALESN